MWIKQLMNNNLWIGTKTRKYTELNLIKCSNQSSFILLAKSGQQIYYGEKMMTPDDTGLKCSYLWVDISGNLLNCLISDESFSLGNRILLLSARMLVSFSFPRQLSAAFSREPRTSVPFLYDCMELCWYLELIAPLCFALPTFVHLCRPFSYFLPGWPLTLRLLLC